MSPHRLLKKAVDGRDWRAPIAAGAYLIMAVTSSVLVTVILGYFLFIRPIESSQHKAEVALVVSQTQQKQLKIQAKRLNAQAHDRQTDTNAFAGAICSQINRQLTNYLDPKARQSSREASYRSIIDGVHFLRKLKPHPPTQCSSINIKTLEEGR